MATPSRISPSWCAPLPATLIGLLGAPAACAQNHRNPARRRTGALNESLLTGSPERGVTVTDSAAPVQIIGPGALRRAGGNPSLVSARAQSVPAFTAQPFGNNMAGQTLQARLRGLSGNDVLALVNGKRRHTTANIEPDSDPYPGCAGTDLNFIRLAQYPRKYTSTLRAHYDNFR